MTEVQFLAGVTMGFPLFNTVSKLALGPNQLPIQCVPGSLTPGVKRPWREIDRSPAGIAQSV
jgi:hypothetical protein